MTTSIEAIPVFGSGIGFRQQIAEQLMAECSALDCVEIVTEHFLHPSTHDQLSALNERVPAIPHGLGLSIGSPAPLREDYLEAVRKVCDVVQAPYYTEHMCMTQAPGIDLGHLAPIWFTEESLALVTDKVARVQDLLGRPLVLENVTYYFDIPGAAMTQGEFFAHVAEATGCGLLLDLANVYANSVNHGFDAIDFLEGLPLDRIVHLHLAGGYWKDGWLVDGHSHAVAPECWDLLQWLVQRAKPRTCILEHDVNFPDDVSPLIDQVGKARAILRA